MSQKFIISNFCIFSKGKPLLNIKSRILNIFYKVLDKNQSNSKKHRIKMIYCRKNFGSIT